MAEDQLDQGEPEELLTLVCVKCGKEYYFEDSDPPEGLSCEKCGGKVFRPFTTTSGDAASEQFDDSTQRDLGTDDSGTETLPGDLLDLNRD